MYKIMVHWKLMDFYTICSPVTVKWRLKGLKFLMELLRSHSFLL